LHGVGQWALALLAAFVLSFSAWAWAYAGSQSTVPECVVGECAFEGIGEAFGWFVGIVSLVIGAVMALITAFLIAKREYRAPVCFAVAVALLVMPFVAYGIGVAVGY
jgi:hypothetical protein